MLQALPRGIDLGTVRHARPDVGRAGRLASALPPLEGFALSHLRVVSAITLVLALGAVGTHTLTLAELRTLFTWAWAWASTPGLGLTLLGVLASDYLASRRAARVVAAPCGCREHQ